jgi:crotonobetainyl-CoA:carnitine CoA-transferase CaiB-like acyl-CoA transferase
MIAAGTDRLFRKLCTVLSRPEWASDPRFSTNRERVEHREALIDLVTAETVKIAIADLIARLDAAGVPNAPLRDAGAVADDVQTRASGMIRAVEGDLQLVGLPFRIDGARPMPRGRAPRLGRGAGSGP